MIMYFYHHFKTGSDNQHYHHQSKSRTTSKLVVKGVFGPGMIGPPGSSSAELVELAFKILNSQDRLCIFNRLCSIKFDIISGIVCY